MLAPSAFLASAASTVTLQESILPSNIKSVPDQSVTSTEIVWEALSSSSIPASNKQHIQKAGNKPRTLATVKSPMRRGQCQTLAASSTQSGDWLHSSPIAAIGFRL